MALSVRAEARVLAPQGSCVSVIISQLMLIYQGGTPLLRRSRVNSHFQALTWEQPGRGSSKHLLALPKQPKTGLFMGCTAAGKSNVACLDR